MIWKLSFEDLNTPQTLKKYCFEEKIDVFLNIIKTYPKVHFHSTSSFPWKILGSFNYKAFWCGYFTILKFISPNTQLFPNINRILSGILSSTNVHLISSCISLNNCAYINCVRVWGTDMETSEQGALLLILRIFFIIIYPSVERADWNCQMSLVMSPDVKCRGMGTVLSI